MFWGSRFRFVMDSLTIEIIIVMIIIMIKAVPAYDAE